MFFACSSDKQWVVCSLRRCKKTSLKIKEQVNTPTSIHALLNIIIEKHFDLVKEPLKWAATLLVSILVSVEAPSDIGGRTTSSELSQCHLAGAEADIQGCSHRRYSGDAPGEHPCLSRGTTGQRRANNFLGTVSMPS